MQIYFKKKRKEKVNRKVCVFERIRGTEAEARGEKELE